MSPHPPATLPPRRRGGGRIEKIVSAIKMDNTMTPMYDTMCRARNRARLSRVTVKEVKLRDESASRGLEMMMEGDEEGRGQEQAVNLPSNDQQHGTDHALRCAAPSNVNKLNAASTECVQLVASLFIFGYVGLNTGIGFNNTEIFALLFCLPADDEKDRKLWKNKKGYKKPPEKTAKGQKTKKV
ncbi:hypothetical protein B0H13DRAFT_1874974 [Mycena leptocephala]|nr:hypothetical protein B0H13DRAFT_1874974 [Mycena leptocephala]